MGLRIKITIFVGLCLLTFWGIFTACSPPEPDWSVSEEVNKENPVNQNYLTVPFSNAVIRAYNYPDNWIMEDILVVNSIEELNSLNLDEKLKYDSDYFESKSILIIQFQHAGGETIKELSRLVIKNNVICPVVIIDSQEDLSPVIQYTIVTAEVNKDDLKTNTGEILVINNFNPTSGSCYYAKYD